jgi:3'-5' exoribonuclease
MTRLPRISDLTAESSGVGFFLCSRKDVRVTRNGTPLLLFTLHDASGEINGKIFEESERYRHEFEPGEFVKLEGRTEVYNGRLELVASRIRRVNPDQDRQDGFKESDCIPSSERDPEEMWQELLRRINGIQDSGIRALLLRLVEDHGVQLRTWPAAVTVHHAYRAGLLEHMLQVARVCHALGEIYGADQDVLLAGALLHDIGKLRELDYELTTTYSRDGNLVGHIALGLMMVREASVGLTSLTHERRAEIEHLIASHHGSREFGSPVEPITIEAFILSAADELDASLYQVRHHLAADDRDGDFTSYHKRLGRVLLKPGASAPVRVRG